MDTPAILLKRQRAVTKKMMAKAACAVDDFPRMTAAVLLSAAIEHDGYETPELNDTLYLHFKGFQRIENLEPYVGLKSIWLEANGLSVIEGLSHLKELRCLFLQRNLISRIENLEGLGQLVTLDVSENRLTVLENLATAVPNLQTLNVSRNALRDAKSIAEVGKMTKLTNLNLEYNKLEGEDIINAIATAPSLCGVNIMGNPVVSTVPQFRKRCIVAMQQLAYLDRPIFEGEREAAAAWAAGGPEAERATKRAIAQRKRDQHKADMDSFRAWQAQCRIEYAERRGMSAEDDSTSAARSRHEEAAAEARLEKEREAQHKADTAALSNIGALGGLLYHGKEPDPTPYFSKDKNSQLADNLPAWERPALEQVIDDPPTPGNVPVDETLPTEDVVIAEETLHTEDVAIAEETLPTEDVSISEMTLPTKDVAIVEEILPNEYKDIVEETQAVSDVATDLVSHADDETVVEVCLQSHKEAAADMELSSEERSVADERTTASMITWQQQARAKKGAQGDISRATTAQKDENLARSKESSKSVASTPQEQCGGWTNTMDKALTILVRKHCFDFHSIAMDMRRTVAVDFGDVDRTSIDAEACRIRWCDLDAKACTLPPPPAQALAHSSEPRLPPILIPRDETSRIPTFAQLQAKAASMPSNVAPPTSLPSPSDFEEDDGDGTENVIAKIPSFEQMHSHISKCRSNQDSARSEIKKLDLIQATIEMTTTHPEDLD